jgi:serine/threonine protein kinase
MNDAHVKARDPLAGVSHIRDRFEAAWRAAGTGEPPCIAEYLKPVPAEDRAALLQELVLLDLQFRRDRGECPQAEAYHERFGDLSLAWVRNAVDTTTPLAPETRIPSQDVLLAQATHPPRLLGEYELGERLGGGGMGVVYRARHRRLGKSVAIKLLPIGAQQSADRVARFLREMQAVGGLKHPHVVEAYDAGEQAGAVYLAMELVEGLDLSELVKQRGPLPVDEACELARQAARGLQYLHERGLVHRDFKPSNLMRTPEGVVKLLDLGLARWRPEAGGAADLTGAGQAMGTPDYLAPEQAQDAAAADGRADLYGLGGTLFYLLTGRAPFAHHRGLYPKLEAHRSEPPPDVRTLRPEVPEVLANLVSRLLAKKPDDRPQTAAEVAVALVAFAQPSTINFDSEPVDRPFSAVRRSSRWRSGLVAGLLLAGLLGLIAWTLFKQGGPQPTEQPLSEAAARQVPAAPLQPLTIRLRVLRLSPDGGNYHPSEIGESTFRTRLNERTEPRVEFSEPAYAYLLAFNPASPEKAADLEQFIPRKDKGRPPDRVSRLDPKKWIPLTDGEGLQAFAVLASRQPLPPYAEWRKRQPALPWQRTKAKSGVVLRSDGDFTREIFGEGIVRGPEEPAGDRVAIEALANWLKGLEKVEAVAVIGFAVDSAE